jgi:hypothetical protein
MADVVIDLDAAGPPPAKVLDRPLWARLSRRQIRLALCAAVALVVAASTGAAAAPAPARFTGPIRIPATLAEDFALFHDGVLVRAENGRVLRSYRLDGKPRWSVPASTGQGLPIETAGDVVLVSNPQWPGETVALDRDTGRERWRLDGSLFATAGDLVVLSFGGTGAFPEDDVRYLSAVRATDGREQWRSGVRLTGTQRSLVVVRQAPYSGWHHAGLGRVEPDGTGVLLDLTTGKWRRVTGMPLPPNTANSAYEYGVVSGDYLVVFSADLAAGGQVRVFGPYTEAPLWSQWTRRGGGSMCGPWICVEDGVQSTVLDVRTGKELRRADWPLVVAAAGRRLLGYTASAQGMGTIAVIDADTGRVVREYPGWNPVLAEFAGWVPMLRRREGLRWEMATLGLADGIAYPLGIFEPSGEQACRSTATHVACAVRSGGVYVWRYAPDSGH